MIFPAGDGVRYVETECYAIFTANLEAASTQNSLKQGGLLYGDMH
jgi:hypothetical protein